MTTRIKAILCSLVMFLAGLGCLANAQLPLTGAGKGAPTPSGGGITQPSGLLIYYTFNDANTTSGTATDTNPNGFGPTNLTLAASPTSATGQISQARSFNGSTQYGATVAYQGPQTATSVLMWAKPTNVLAATQLLAAQFNTNGGNSWYFQFFVATDGTVFARILQGDTGVGGTAFIGRTTNAGAVVDGSFQHIAFTWSGGVTNAAIKIYVDGTQVDTTDNSSSVFVAPDTSTITLNVGAQNTGNNPFNGAIDDFRIYNRELSLSDITAVYTAGLGGNP